ncbi:MAG: helix-turn-helix domain-containing protein [Chloroflexales bacterium]|nr:helix-turn-helix domain-containing protein [Chloroflexales bacterium]
MTDEQQPSPESDQPEVDPLTVGELQTLKELAQDGLLAYSTLRQHARSGRLRAKRMGHQWFSTQTAVEQFLRERQAKHIPKKYR